MWPGVPIPPACCILGTYRPVDAIVHAHPLRTVLTELQQHGQCAELALDYLSEAEVVAYLRQRFGDPRLAADLARVLHQRTHGESPLLDRRRGGARPSAGGARGTSRVGAAARGGDDPAIIPATLRALIEHQLAHVQSRGPDAARSRQCGRRRVHGRGGRGGPRARRRRRWRPSARRWLPRAVSPGAWPRRMARWHGDRVFWLSPCPLSRRLISAHPGGAPDPLACPDWGTAGTGLRRAGR